MQSEIMTPRVQSKGPVSRISIGALEDLGYTVDYSQADDFGSSDLASSCQCSESSTLSRRALIRKVSKQLTRELSVNGLEAAVAYGKELISKHQPNMQSKFDFAATTDYIIGNAAVVLVYEDGELFSVTTTL